MTTHQFTYTINSTTYIQKPLVFGQIRQLTSVIEKIITSGGINLDAGVFGLIDALGAELPLALAVVLTPSGENPKNKNLAELAEKLEFEIELDQVMEIVTDFFDCNPIQSLLTKLLTMIGNIKKTVPTKATGSNNAFVTSPEATSPSGTQLSGDAHPLNPGSTLSSESETPSIVKA